MADKKINGSLEITGKLNPNASGYGFNLPSSDSLTADKTIATEKYVDNALLSKADLVNGLVPAAQLPSYVDDVLESSDKAHFPSTGEKGKIYVALDTGFTYRWSGSEYVQIGGQDLSNFVTLDTDQTIAGKKTFSNEAKFSSTYNGGTAYSFEADDTYGQLRIAHDNRRLLTINDTGIMPNGPISLGNPSYHWQDLYLSGKCCTNDIDSSDNMFFGKTGYTQYARGILASASNGLYDLGKLSNKWKDLYLSGNISDGTTSVSVSDIASSTFNVINASDIVNNTLTQEQYDLITNGKPTLIKGVYNNHEDTIIMPTEARSGAYTLGMFLGRADSDGQIVGGYYLHNVNRSLYYYAQSDRVNRLGGIKSLNGKDLPTYPSTNTSPQALQIGVNGGNLSWSDDGLINVINASDIVDNTLTQDQYNLITNGKPTLIKGTFLSGYTNFVLFPPLERSVDFIFEAHYTTGYPAFVLGLVLLNKATKVISLNTNKFYRGEQFDSISSSKFNGKSIPAYPSDTGTFNLKQIDGALTWTKEWYGTQAEYDALGTYDDNTIYNITEE